MYTLSLHDALPILKENLELIARIYGISNQEATKKADEMLSVFGLTKRAKDRANSLSGGMQRKLSIAMSLITNPKILFLDEPTIGLDVTARRNLWKIISELKGRSEERRVGKESKCQWGQ